LSDPGANVIAIWEEWIIGLSVYLKEFGDVVTDYENSVREEYLEPVMGSVMVQTQALYAEWIPLESAKHEMIKSEV
jgi:hypothetical protein